MSVRSRGRLLLAVALVVGSAGCWRQPGFGPERSGWNPWEDELLPRSGLNLEWEARLDDGPVRGDPVLSRSGLLHVADDVAAYGIVPRTGARAWRTPVVPDRLVDLGATTRGVTSDETTLHVAWGGVPDNGGATELDPRTGAETGQGPGVGLLEPVVRDGTRVTPFSGFIEDTLAGAGVLVDAPGGFWSFVAQIGGADPLPAPTSAAMGPGRFWLGMAQYDPGYIGVGEGTNILGGWGHEPCSFDPPCAPEVWTQLDGAPTTPILSGDHATVYVATDAGTLYAVDAADGTVVWTADLGAPATLRPAFDGTTVFVATDDGLRAVVVPACAGLTTCAVGRPTPLGADPVRPPAIAAGTVYVPVEGGAVEAYPASDAEVAAPTWTGRVGAEVTGGPTIAGGRLYVGTEDGRVLSYGMPDVTIDG